MPSDQRFGLGNQVCSIIDVIRFIQQLSNIQSRSKCIVIALACGVCFVFVTAFDSMDHQALWRSMNSTQAVSSDRSLVLFDLSAADRETTGVMRPTKER